MGSGFVVCGYVICGTRSGADRGFEFAGKLSDGVGAPAGSFLGLLLFGEQFFGQPKGREREDRGRRLTRKALPKRTGPLVDKPRDVQRHRLIFHADAQRIFPPQQIDANRLVHGHESVVGRESGGCRR